MTWTDRFSACSWPTVTLEADSFSVVLLCALVMVRVCTWEAEPAKSGSPL